MECYALDKGLQITLFTTDHCSLCDLALDTLLGLPQARGVMLRTVDVATSAELIAAYGERIPVFTCTAPKRLLKHLSQQGLTAELAAPITASAVAGWLNKLQAAAAELDQ